jgi:hypothetical protein
MNFIKDKTVTWVNINIDWDVYDERGGPSGYEYSWDTYSLIVDGITVADKREMKNETIRIGSVDYVVTFIDITL